MKILIVHSGNAVRNDSSRYSYVYAQGCALQLQGCEVSYFSVVGKGVMAYLKAIPLLRKKIREVQPDVIHAHYGLSCLLANMATRRVPVVSTYHGSDINLMKVRPFSKVAMWLSAWNIFVSRRTLHIMHGEKRKNCSLIPCGVTLTDDQLQTKEEARKVLGWKLSEKKVLFAGAFDNMVKQPELAFATMNELKNEGMNEVELMELKGYTREEVNTLMCACNCLLMTSKTEGSPQVIKEAMACGCPIVSVDVGDVKERVAGVDGCYVVTMKELRVKSEEIRVKSEELRVKSEELRVKELEAALKKALAFEGKTKGREHVLAAGLTNEQIAEKLLTIYREVTNKV